MRPRTVGEFINASTPIKEVPTGSRFWDALGNEMVKRSSIPGNEKARASYANEHEKEMYYAKHALVVIINQSKTDGGHA